MSLEILEPPVGEPVSLTEVRTYLRIGTQGEDDLLALFVTAAREMFETRTGRALVSRRVRQNFLGPLQPGFLLPAASPVSLIYGVRQLLADGSSRAADPGLITLMDGKFKLQRDASDLSVDYQAGFASVVQIPQAYRLAILEEVGQALIRRDAEAVVAASQALKSGAFGQVRL